MQDFERFDAVQVTHLPEGKEQIPVYYSATGVTHLKVGDVGVVLGKWPGNKLRIEAVDRNCQIAWQDHLDPKYLQRLDATAATYSRRRINEHWACQHQLSEELLDPITYREALSFARKVMKFAERNVDLLTEKLVKSGYQFASKQRFRTPARRDGEQCFAELASLGIFVPISLQAWCLEVGGVDFCGSHPAWPKSAYYGIGKSEGQADPWYTDPLSIDLDVEEWLKVGRSGERDGSQILLDVAPDIVHKANISGGGPVSVSGTRPSFDPVLINQPGSFTLLSYLRWAFEWGGFPGFEYIIDAPNEILAEWREGLTRL